MRTAQVGIVGGGLSGLYAAYLLEQNGYRDYVLLEAREALGGRIASASVPRDRSAHAAQAGDDSDHFDLGPTWFWPDLQPRFDQLIIDLGLSRFAQHDTGDIMVERSLHAPPVRTKGYANAPAAMRLSGGMGALIDSLGRHLDASNIILGHAVHRLRLVDPVVEIDAQNAAGDTTTWRVGHVLLAMPPRLFEHRVQVTPALPPALARSWRATPTWMAPHAKYIAVYETPFWRQQGLSGQAHSVCGPLGEIHDASLPNDNAALFGFFGLPAHRRQQTTPDNLRAQCRAQMSRLFGPQAGAPKAEFIKDWALGDLTCTAADLNEAGQHVQAPMATPLSGPWAGRLTGIGSEWSPGFAGYLAGAVEAAGLGVAAWRGRSSRA